MTLPPLVWRRSPNFSGRHGTPVELFVLHETAGAYAGAVAWLRRGDLPPERRASAHFVLREDGAECSQLVRLADKAWTQSAFNPRCVSLELANITAKGYHSETQLRRAARIAGWVLKREHLPVRWAKGGHGLGLVRHLELGAAGGGHTQCGPSPEGWHRFLNMVEHEVARGGYRKTWAR